jgi:hypothetical protein
VKANRFGYRVEYDRIDGAHYVLDPHGAVVHGPHPTDEAAWQWIEAFTEQRLQLRDQQAATDEATQRRIAAVMRYLFARDRTVAVPANWRDYEADAAAWAQPAEVARVA